VDESLPKGIVPLGEAIAEVMARLAKQLEPPGLDPQRPEMYASPLPHNDNDDHIKTPTDEDFKAQPAKSADLPAAGPLPGALAHAEAPASC
jgi:hypothetical protein